MMTNDDLLPVVLVVDDQPERFSELVRSAERYDGGRLAREFSFEYAGCYAHLQEWYQQHRGRFVALLVQDVDFTATHDEQQLLSFPETGLRPAAEPQDPRVVQGFIIYHRLRSTSVDRVVPVLFTSCAAALEHGREFADFIVYPGHGTCAFAPDPAPGSDSLAGLLAAIDTHALRPLDKQTRRRWREQHRMAVGRSRKMAGLAHEVERIGPTDGTVLLLGNPGAGKELVANALHRCSPRHAAGDEKREHPLAVNMVALERNLVLDELFGHERGAFTGASLERAGIFETARGGTVLLDEIGEIDAELQQKLLRVIESRCVRRLGSSIEAPVDVRIVCATNRPIDVLQTRFRWDFYTRVVQQTIAVPSLRERWAEESPHVLEEDIAELFEFVVDEMNRNPRHRRQIRPAATAIRFMTGLVAQYLDGTNSIFAGEMRALRNVIERAYERAQYDGAEAISMGQVAFTLTRFQPLGPQTKPKPAGWSLENTFGSLRLAVVERVVIAEALARARSNQKKAAELLGIHRDTLRNKMREYGLSQ